MLATAQAPTALEVLEVEASLLPNRSLEEPTALLGGELLDRQPQDMGPTGGHLFQVESASKQSDCDLVMHEYS